MHPKNPTSLEPETCLQAGAQYVQARDLRSFGVMLGQHGLAQNPKPLNPKPRNPKPLNLGLGFRV